MIQNVNIELNKQFNKNKTLLLARQSTILIMSYVCESIGYTNKTMVTVSVVTEIDCIPGYLLY